MNPPLRFLVIEDMLTQHAITIEAQDGDALYRLAEDMGYEW